MSILQAASISTLSGITGIEDQQCLNGRQGSSAVIVVKESSAFVKESLSCVETLYGAEQPSPVGCSLANASVSEYMHGREFSYTSQCANCVDK